jgi:hypothetical protein
MSHATPHTPQPPTLPDALPLAVTVLGAIVLIVIGAPVS